MDKKLKVYLEVLKEVKDNIKVLPSPILRVFLLNRKTNERVLLGDFDNVIDLLDNVEPFCRNLKNSENFVILVKRDFHVYVEFDGKLYKAFTKSCVIDVLSVENPDLKSVVDCVDKFCCPF